MSRQHYSRSHQKNRKSLNTDKKQRFHKKQNKKYLKKLAWAAYTQAINGLHQLYRNELAFADAPLLLQGVGVFFQSEGYFEPKQRADFLAFLKDILSPENLPILYAPTTLYNVFRFRKYWLNDPATWQPSKAWKPTNQAKKATDFCNSFKRELVQHVFVQYTMPEFMYAIWQDNNLDHLHWFIHLGKGGSIKDVHDLPFAMNSKMAHYFTQAPAHYPVNKALLYGKVRALGGTNDFFEQWYATDWRQIYKDEAFFKQLIQFFANYPQLINNREVVQVINFINAHKYNGQLVYTRAQGIVQEAPAAPKFSLKGRTDHSLMRLVNNWLRSPRVLGKGFDETILTWTPDPTNDFEYWDEEQQALYKISQLINSYELWLEGKSMMHCVGTYTHKCMGGYSTIWTMTKVNAKGQELKCVTIEMGKKWRIIEIRGMRNRQPKTKEMEVIRHWVNKENLALSIDYL
jgi:hypothetical protein